MTRKPPPVIWPTTPPPTQTPKGYRLGYTLESRICLTPNQTTGIHTHVTIHIDSSAETGIVEDVERKAHEDFCALVTHLGGDASEYSLDEFIDSLATLNLYAIADEEGDLDASEATHVTPGRFQ